jgi:pre-60S factor REI1
MSQKHGFFIPDSEYCCDIEGLIKYLGGLLCRTSDNVNLGLKIGAGNYCIKCPNKRFGDLNACQLHMRDKSHCIFSVEGEQVVEYLDFYDYGYVRANHFKIK